jgi:hypothetical protein
MGIFLYFRLTTVYAFRRPIIISPWIKNSGAFQLRIILQKRILNGIRQNLNNGATHDRASIITRKSTTITKTETFFLALGGNMVF